MTSVESSTIVLHAERKRFVSSRSEYDVDLWREFKKRWMVFGVLGAVALAVISPRLGAPGGNYPACKLRMEIVRCCALWNLYYITGRSTGLRGENGVREIRARLYALSVLHAQVIAPVLAAVSALALRDANLDRRLLEGALVARSRGPCGWLSLALCCDSSPTTPVLAAINYVVSLLTAPLAILFFCGRTALPPLSGIVWTVVTTAAPFLIGCWRSQRLSPRAPRTITRLLALLLLYIDCSALLRDAEGSLYITDVLATLFLEISSVSLAAAGSSLYAHYGLLRRSESRALALAAVPKAVGLGWEMKVSCMSSGLAHLPTVFLAPTQALLMAALYGTDKVDQLEEDLTFEDLPLLRE
ncbi:hypothetical protein RR46_12376 [Papilio xuthus]|uniref:Uncharacterized protein n=1 Tax=Papilio xuthus TaxID=66420 RepID=A0A194PSD2_PAPXU|nr:hypothetical protein RR46_12376 [Papilio xuthus]